LPGTVSAIGGTFLSRAVLIGTAAHKARRGAFIARHIALM